MAKEGLLGKSKLIGVVKEIAPCPTAKDDSELGVGEFQSKYFNFPLYLDEEKTFYSALGNRKITSDLKGSWNPFEVYQGFKAIGERIKAKNLEGNFRGEGLILGGILVVSPSQGVVYTYYEETGKEIPKDDIIDAIQSCTISRAKSFRFW